MREYGRDLRVADFVREELAGIIHRQMRDPRIGSVSVNHVRVSKDLAFADVYVSSLDTPEAEQQRRLVAVLNGASGFFRSQLAGRNTMRTTPKPRFHYDVSIERGPRLERMIAEAVAADRSMADDG